MAELHLNQDPRSKAAVLRHLGRIQRLRAAKSKNKYANSVHKFQKEIDQRARTLSDLGVELPSSDNLLADLISKIDSNTDGRV